MKEKVILGVKSLDCSLKIEDVEEIVGTVLSHLKVRENFENLYSALQWAEYNKKVFNTHLGKVSIKQRFLKMMGDGGFPSGDIIRYSFDIILKGEVIFSIVIQSHQWYDDFVKEGKIEYEVRHTQSVWVCEPITTPETLEWLDSSIIIELSWEEEV